MAAGIVFLITVLLVLFVGDVDNDTIVNKSDDNVDIKQLMNNIGDNKSFTGNSLLLAVDISDIGDDESCI